MLIRCEKCNTLYELDEKLLPPQGAPVQCSKCQFVFKAYPGPREEPPAAIPETAATGDGASAEAPAPTAREGDGGEPAPMASEPAEAESPGASGDPAPERRAAAPVAPSEPAAAKSQPHAPKRTGPQAGPAAGPEEPQFTADGRPIRKVPFPTEEPSPMGPRPVLGRVPARSSASSRQRRWALVVVPVAVALLLAAAFVAWRMLGRRSDAASQGRAEGHSLLLREERESPYRPGLPPPLTPASPVDRGRPT